ncbi:uncharacterized protein THITE_2110300 [Thermothielavioides terrestris NRRL 8126]|uniref:Heterokaryon incompatibility domain-containing protein n=1 Tax=Thermothielavioides terrestris (strain ATCC 38088 / NRRL 8126) TaxID=578455 RepID=G2QSA8_THETT|nr:uncharacterized protein THITE_2110300 [Thermothielavioides terrestris NRRL 8126]AEO64297.1 hypothetical protein THITE_2110300 [Thermothielavioides terrestris NRRL 8126]
MALRLFLQRVSGRGETEYTYKPLKDGEIRVLHLLPGTGRMRLEAEIESVDIASAESYFEALSYCWGSDLKPKVIYIDGAPLPITRALASLLQRLRLPTERRRLWTDAICINQDDKDEKGRQIALMARIYTVAATVNVDIGEETLDSSLALELLDRFWKKHVWSGVLAEIHGAVLPPEDFAKWVGVVLPEKPGDEGDEAFSSSTAGNPAGYPWMHAIVGRLLTAYRWASLAAEFYGRFSLPGLKNGLSPGELPPDDDPRWRSVSHLFTRPWFSRTWVIQEFALAREVAVICGTKRYKWQNILAGIYRFISGELPPLANSSASVRGRYAYLFMGVLRQVRVLRRTAEGRAFLARTQSSAYQWRKFQEARLVDVLHYFRISEVSIEKDRYFALLSVVDDVGTGEDGHRPRLQLNYASSTESTIIQVGRFLIQNPYGEEMLARAGLWQQQDPRIPSWIQDFRGSRKPIVMMDQTTTHMGEQAGGPGPFRVALAPELDAHSAGGACFIMLRGYRLDVVDTAPLAARFLSMESTDSGIFGAMKEYLPLALKTLIGDGSALLYAKGEPLTTALCATLISGNRLNGEKDYTPLTPGFHILSWVSVARNNEQAVLWALRRAVRHLGVDFETAKKSYLGYVTNVEYSAVSQRLQPARTRKGYFASLPSCFEPADEIWIVQGCRDPLLLRKSRLFPGSYQLVRSCYVHGFMEGEALNRPGFRFEQLLLH